VKFWERGKSSGRHSRSLGFSRVWPWIWPRLDHTCVSTWSIGSLGLVGEVFEVKTQVDRDLTTASSFDRLLRLNKNLGCHNSEYWVWLRFSPISTQNLKCCQWWKVCPSKRWTTFILADFEVFKWKFENTAKFLGKALGSKGLTRVLTLTLTKVWPQGCDELIRGSLVIVELIFEVMTQVDQGLTRVNVFDLVISTNELIRSLRRHNF
jgi:hypothetical protein